MWTQNKFIIITIIFKLVYCKTIYSPLIQRNPGQFQWQFQSLGGGLGQSLYMFPMISGLGSSSSSSSSSGNGGATLNFDDKGSQSQSQSSTIDNGIVKITSSNNKKLSNTGTSYMSLTDKNGNIKIKISSPNIQSIADNIKVQVSDDNSEDSYNRQPVIHYVYTLPTNKGNQEKFKTKGLIKIYTPVSSSSASASASSSSEGQSQSQTITIDNGHKVKEISEDENTEDEIVLQPQIQSITYKSQQEHQKNKLTLRGKSNVEDKKACKNEKGEYQAQLEEIEIQTQEDIIVAVFCENTKAEINCDQNNFLRILKANTIWTDICPEKEISLEANNKNCSKSILDEIKFDCDGKESCVVEGHEDKYEYPCTSKTKYLQIFYSCYC